MAGFVTCRTRGGAMMDITEQAIGDVTVLRLAGRLVLEGAESTLRAEIERLVALGRLKLVLDLREVTYIDSAGLGLLVAKLASVRRRGGDVRLAHLTDRSTHLMAITNLAKIFATFTSETDAVLSYAAG